MQLFILFTEKGWVKNEFYRDVLERFGNLMESLTYEQTELILELTERYTWLSYGEYSSILRKLFIELHKRKLNNITRIYIFPIKNVKHETQVKSGDVIQYVAKGVTSLLNEYSDIEIIHLTKFEELEDDNLKIEDNCYVILLDDYIGTGKTLNSTLEKVFKNESINNNNLSILSTIINKDTVLELRQKEIDVLYGIETIKGISQFYNDEIVNHKVEIMKGIEDKIPGVKGFRFGFEKSEGLVTLLRTPNNTFPVFWKETKHRKKSIKAPFPRY